MEAAITEHEKLLEQKKHKLKASKAEKRDQESLQGFFEANRADMQRFNLLYASAYTIAEIFLALPEY